VRHIVALQNSFRKLVYCTFQHVVSYQNSQRQNATVIFRSTTSGSNSVNRFPQCVQEGRLPQLGVSAVSAGEVCLAPRLAVSPSSRLVGYASALVSLTATVAFADNCFGCAKPYDPKYDVIHKVYPVTNHHSPALRLLFGQSRRTGCQSGPVDNFEERP
jgi:hypothetical protein